MKQQQKRSLRGPISERQTREETSEDINSPKRRMKRRKTVVAWTHQYATTTRMDSYKPSLKENGRRVDQRAKPTNGISRQTD